MILLSLNYAAKSRGVARNNNVVNPRLKKDADPVWHDKEQYSCHLPYSP
jgi:hypothetical protein